ncbi:MAG: RHS repeat-associated core domain-containing protein, partial [Deltaproteobacteria bacterium]
GSGSTYSRPLDEDGRVASFTLNGLPRTVTYDAAGRITDLTDALGQSFTYDNLDRLATYTSSTLSQTFSYDEVGNRTQFSDGTNSDTYTYDPASNRLLSIAGSHAKTYTYAANGNTTDDGSHFYFYDARNRLIDVDYSTSYTLNGLGERIKKDSGATLTYAAGDANGDGAFTADDTTAIVDQILQVSTATGNPDCNQDGDVNVQDLACLNIRIASGASPSTGGTVIFAYDEQGQLIGEYDQTGAVIEETVYLANQPVAVVKQSGVYYIHTDQLNTPRVITDDTDKIVWRWDSDPFGTTAANDDPDMDGIKFTYNLRFPGQYYDSETGLHYNYFRDYDPSTGRYIESDPIGILRDYSSPQLQLVIDFGSLEETGIAGDVALNHLYAYVTNNPLGSSDPFGLDSIRAKLMAAIARGDVRQIESLMEVLSPELRKLAENALKKFTSKADDWIQAQCKGRIRDEFPSEFLDKTLQEIRQGSSAAAKKAWKLLNDKRFQK